MTKSQRKNALRKQLREKAGASGAGYRYDVHSDPHSSTASSGVYDEVEGDRINARRGIEDDAHPDAVKWHGGYLSWNEALDLVQPGQHMTVSVYKSIPGNPYEGELQDTVVLKVPA